MGTPGCLVLVDTDSASTLTSRATTATTWARPHVLTPHYGGGRGPCFLGQRRLSGLLARGPRGERSRHGLAGSLLGPHQAEIQALGDGPVLVRSSGSPPRSGRGPAELGSSGTPFHGKAHPLLCLDHCVAGPLTLT